MTSKQYVEGFGEVKVGISAKIVKEAKIEISRKGDVAKRASLINPTRPETPHSEHRSLYNFAETYSNSRPNSALLGSVGKLEPIISSISKAQTPVVIPNNEVVVAKSSIENSDPIAKIFSSQIKSEHVLHIKELLSSHQVEELDTYLCTLMEENINYEEKTNILEELCKFDTSSAQLKFTILKIFISFACNEQQMKTASYLAFQLSKLKENDLRFLEEHLLEKIVELTSLQSIPNSDIKRDIVLYSLATLKNLSSGNILIRKELSRINTFQVVRNLLSKQTIKVLEDVLTKDALMNPKRVQSASQKARERIAQLLTVALELLRNLWSESAKEIFISSGVIEDICSLLDVNSPFCKRRELVTNISRVLNSLIGIPELRSTIAKNKDFLNSIFNCLRMYPQEGFIINRIGFCLATITGVYDEARITIFENTDSIRTLLSILGYYYTKDSSLSDVNPENSELVKTKGEVEDVLVKIIRLIGNLAINETIGPEIAKKEELSILHKLLKSKKIEESEELVLNTIGCITNLSYYGIEENVVIKLQEEASQALIPYIMHSNEEVIIEAARAFGNFTRNSVVRKILLQEKKIVETLCNLLEYSNREIQYNTCGILMNLMLEFPSIQTLNKAALERLKDLLQMSGKKEDLQMCSTICKALFNYSTQNNPKELFSREEEETLINTLKHLLSSLANVGNKDDREEFVSVANQLLEVLDGQTTLVPLEK